MWPPVSSVSLGLARQPEPEHVDRRADVLDLRPARSRTVEWRPSQPTTSVGADFDVAVRRFGAHADDAVALRDQIGGLGLHAQMEFRIALALLGEEIEEVPLRHQRDEFAAGRQMAEVHHRDALGADLEGQARHLLVRHLEEFVEQAELVHQLERRGMNGVAAEVAEEILVLLQHDDVDAGAGEQKAEHHAGRPAAGDAAARGDGFGHRRAIRSRRRARPPCSRRAASVPKASTTTAAPTSMPRSASMP